MNDFYNGNKTIINKRVKTKPKAESKLFKEVKKLDMSDYNEENWIRYSELA